MIDETATRGEESKLPRDRCGAEGIARRRDAATSLEDAVRLHDVAPRRRPVSLRFTRTRFQQACVICDRNGTRVTRAHQHFLTFHY